MSDLAQATNANAEPVTIDGREFYPHAISFRGIGHLQACLNALPKPHDLKALKAELDGMPPEVATPILRRACDENMNWPPRLLEPGDAYSWLIHTPELQADLLLVALEGFDGISLDSIATSREKATALRDRIDLPTFHKLMRAAFDLKDAEGLPEGVAPDPKGP